MKTFVEFYFPGVSCAGSFEKEVASREPEAINFVPQNAISYRFFDKANDGSKVNYSSYHYIGEEFTLEKFKISYPQLAGDFDNSTVKRIAKATTGAFYPLSESDIVVPA